MKWKWFVGSTVGVMIALAALSCSGNKADDGKIRALISSKCSMCHFSKRIYQQPRPAEEWAMIVPRMRAINPSLTSKEDADVILDYLTEHVSE